MVYPNGNLSLYDITDRAAQYQHTGKHTSESEEDEEVSDLFTSQHTHLTASDVF